MRLRSDEIGGLYLREVEPLHVTGKPGKADVWRARLEDGTRVVVKDFSLKPGLWRLWGRVLVRREEALLRRLMDVPEVPDLVRCDSPLTVVQVAVPGEPLFRTPRAEFDPQHLVRLRAIVGEIHRRGIVHNDLRARDNTLIDRSSGRLYVVDWAGGIRLRPGSGLHRALFGRLRLVDLSALAKWRAKLAPGTLSSAERQFIERYRIWRYLWPFNRKGLSRRGREA
jgi:hypothetical protein